METFMEMFIVDGAEKKLADIIVENRVSGVSCYVASYGFGIRQVERLISAFDNVLLLADESHAHLNKNAYNTVVEMSNNLDCFTFKALKTHAKFAFIDNEVIIFTSANLSANRRMEAYMVGGINEANGAGDVLDFMQLGQLLEKAPAQNDDLIFDFEL